MALLLTESDVTRLLRMEEVIAAVEAAFAARGAGVAVNRPRNRIFLPDLTLHVMSAALPRAGLAGLPRAGLAGLPRAGLAGLPPAGVIGVKAYAAGRGGARFVVLAWSAATGALEAVIEADRLGQMRTGAASGVATKYMARPDARTVGCIGTGRQAQTQIEAICAVRPVARVRVFGRDALRRRAFADKMAGILGIAVEPAPAAEAAIRGADIAITITTASEPVLFGRWLHPGIHVNAAGANRARKRELDEAAVRLADRIVVDDREQASIECGDLLQVVKAGALSWDAVHELGDVVVGKVPGRTGPEEITLFESQGVAIEDLAAAAVLIERARASGVGMDIPIGR